MTPVNEYPVLSMPSIFPLSPSTRNALPSGNAKKATSLTHTQCGEAGGSGSMVPAGSGGSCARAVAPLTAAARANAAQARAGPRGWITSPRRAARCSEVLTDLDADGTRLVEEQPRPAGDFRGNRTVIAEIRHLVGEILAEQRGLGGTIREREARIQQPVGGALARQRRAVGPAEAAAHIGVVEAAHQVPGVRDRHGVLQRCVTGPVGHLEDRRAHRLRRLAYLGDLRILVAEADRALQLLGGPRAQLELPSLALRGAGVGDELKAALQEDLLLNVVPADIECRGIQDDAAIEPRGLGAELIVPERVGPEAARVGQRDVRVHGGKRRHAVVERAGRTGRHDRHYAARPEALGGEAVDHLVRRNPVVELELGIDPILLVGDERA